MLKVTAANRNFRIFAERFDEGQHRERRTAKVAEISKFIGATLVKMAELSMPVCNSWYEVAKSARGIHRNFLSDVEICDLTDENNVALKQPYLFQVPIYYTVALVSRYPVHTGATVVGLSGRCSLQALTPENKHQHENGNDKNEHVRCQCLCIAVRMLVPSFRMARVLLERGG